MKGSQILQNKSVNVEDAANELISMLCDVPDYEEDEVERDEVAEEDEEGDGGAEKEKEGTKQFFFYKKC